MPTRPRMIIVESDIDTASLLGRLLLSRGFDVTLANSGKDFHVLVRDEVFHLALMEIKLPDTTGYELSRFVRQRYRHMAVLLMGILPAEQERLSASFNGAKDYIEKPFSIVDLERRLNAALGRA